MPCAITNIAAYWCIEKGYSQFNCSTAQQLEIRASEVQLAMQSENPYGYGSYDYFQDGFDIFSHTENGNTYTLGYTKYEKSQSYFSWENMVNEINAGRPFVLGFSGTPYGGPHVTVCAGYEIVGNTRYVYLSDSQQSTFRREEFTMDKVDAFIVVDIVIS